MDLAWSDADLRFRDEVRGFLDCELTPDLRKAGKSLTSVYADYDVTMKWHHILYRKGWVAPAWPKEYGGTGWNVVQRFIWASETAAAGAPPLSPMGLGMCGPVIIGHTKRPELPSASILDNDPSQPGNGRGKNLPPATPPSNGPT